MQSYWILIGAIVAVAWSLPSGPITKQSLTEALSSTEGRNSALENLVLNLLESLRGTIQDGSGIIPPLDPLEIPNLVLDDDIIPLPGAEVSMVNLRVENLASFVVDQLSITMTSLLFQRYRVLFDVRIPNLDASAEHYEIDVSALGYNIFGAGNLRVRVIDPKVITNLLIRLRIRGGGMYLELEECEIKVSLGGFEPQITGLFGHEGVSDFVNVFLRDLVPTVVEFYEAEITQFVSTNVHQIANTILADLDLGSLINP